MKRFTLTTVDQLKPGDQFMKQDDKNEIVYTMKEFKPLAKNRYCVKKGDLMMPDIANGNEQVIFLRHK